MTKEFFVPGWLKERPLVYMISHMAIMPLIDLYATACDWLPAGSAVHEGFGLTLGAFLLLSLVNGTVIEIARKSWAPEQEREGVETYSRLWGPGAAGVAVMSVVLVGLALSAFVNVRSGAGVWLLAALLAGAALGGLVRDRLCRDADTEDRQGDGDGKRRVCAGNYLLLGVLPLLVSLWHLSDAGPYVLTGEAAMSPAVAGGKGAALAKLAATFPRAGVLRDRCGGV